MKLNAAEIILSESPSEALKLLNIYRNTNKTERRTTVFERSLVTVYYWGINNMQSSLDLSHGKQPAAIYFLQRFYWTRNDP